MGEWSPICKACWWDEGDSAKVGACFTGRNETPERTWETRSEVVAADKGSEFAFVVGQAIVKWAYKFSAVEGGSNVTESWEFLPGGHIIFGERYAQDAEKQIEDRAQAARKSIPATLASIKQIAESTKI